MRYRRRARMWYGGALAGLAMVMGGCALLEPTAGQSSGLVSRQRMQPLTPELAGAATLLRETTEEVRYDAQGNVVARVLREADYGLPTVPVASDFRASEAFADSETGLESVAGVTGSSVRANRSTAGRADTLSATTQAQMQRTQDAGMLAGMVAESAVRGAVEGLGIVNARMIRSSEERTARRLSDNEARVQLAEIEATRPPAPEPEAPEVLVTAPAGGE